MRRIGRGEAVGRWSPRRLWVGGSYHATLTVLVGCALLGCKGKKKPGKPAGGDAAVLAASGDGGSGGPVGPGAPVRDKLDAIEQAEDARASGAILPYLRDSESPVRARAARGLGRIGDEASLPQLRALLEDPVREVRIEVADALAIAGDAKAGPELVKRFTLETQDPYVSRAILRAIGFCGGDEGLSVLGGALLDDDAETRAEGALALGRYGVRKKVIGAERVNELSKRLKDEDEGVRYAAAFALVRAKELAPAAPAPSAAPGAAQPPAVTPAPSPSPAAVDAGVPAPPPAPEVIPAPLEVGHIEALLAVATGGGAPETAAMALRALAIRKALPEVDALAILGRDADWRVQVEAARGLIERPDAKLAAALTGLMKVLPAMVGDARTHVAIAALEALATRAKVPGVAKAIRPLLALPDPAGDPLPRRRRFAQVRCSAAAVLAHGGAFDALAKCDPALLLGTLPRRALADALSDGAATVKGGQLDARLKALTTLAGDKDATVRAAAAAAAGSFDDARAQRIVRERLAEDDIGVVTAAADAARVAAEERKHADFAALNRLVEIATRLRGAEWIEARISAVTTLGAFPAHANVDSALETALGDPSGEVSRRARAALEKRGKKPPAARPVPPDPVPHPELPRDASVKATITVEGGATLSCTLDHAVAPRTVDSFVGLARKKLYDGLTFHRVVPDFVVQGGDPRGDGTGGPGYLLRAEASLKPFARGALGIADAGKDTGGSQFFIMHARAPHLEGRYTWFGSCDTTAAAGQALDLLFVGDKIEKVTVDVR